MSSFANLIRAAFRAPFTMLLVVVALAAQAAVESSRRPNESTASAVGRHTVSFERFPDEPELAGLLSVWSYRFKRLGASLFVHSSLATLAVSTAMTLALGVWIEPHWGSVRFASIWMLTALAGFAVAWMVLETPLGYLSGNCGVLFAAGRFPPSGDTPRRLMARWVVPVTVSAVLLVIFLTLTGQGHGPYIAWLTAMACGWWLGAGLPGAEGEHHVLSAFRVLPWVVGLWLFAATHPIWYGSYHWYRAKSEKNVERRIAFLRRATDVDPQLIGPPIELSEILAGRREFHRAWRVLVETLRRRRGDERLEAAVQRHWRRFDTEGERIVARDTLREVFQGESAHWERRLGLTVSVADRDLNGWEEADSPPPGERVEERFPLDQKIELPTTLDGKPEVSPRELRLPAPKADGADGAAEGRKT